MANQRDSENQPPREEAEGAHRTRKVTKREVGDMLRKLKVQRYERRLTSEKKET